MPNELRTEVSNDLTKQVLELLKEQSYNQIVAIIDTLKVAAQVPASTNPYRIFLLKISYTKQDFYKMIINT
jgi:hypothetical protein